jgi:hypothetical protein
VNANKEVLGEIHRSRCNAERVHWNAQLPNVCAGDLHAIVCNLRPAQLIFGFTIFARKRLPPDG